MTRILALETAGETCSVAIMDGDKVLEHFEQAPRRQTERVLPMVEALLAESQLTLRQLDGIAFGHGLVHLPVCGWPQLLPRDWPLRRTCR